MLGYSPTSSAVINIASLGIEFKVLNFERKSSESFSYIGLTILRYRFDMEV